MAMFDVNAMYWGSKYVRLPGTDVDVDRSANLITASYPAELKFGISAALDPVEVGILLPAKQTDGSTATSGTMTVTIKTYKADGTTVVDTVTRTYTLGTAQYDIVRVARSLGARNLGIVCSGATVNAGPATIGLVMGGNDQNRAG